MKGKAAIGKTSRKEEERPEEGMEFVV